MSFAAETHTTLLQLWLSSSSEFPFVTVTQTNAESFFLVVTGQLT